MFHGLRAALIIYTLSAGAVVVATALTMLNTTQRIHRGSLLRPLARLWRAGRSEFWFGLRKMRSLVLKFTTLVLETTTLSYLFLIQFIRGHLRSTRRGRD